MITVSSTVLDMVTRIMVCSVTVANESPSPNSTRHPKKIPGESVSWNELREDDQLHADKTVYLERLLENEGKNVFFYITRPRRSGKSSFLTMAKFFFQGNDTLFKDLKIDERGNTHFFIKPSGHGVPENLKGTKWIECPVIYLDFSDIENFDNKTRFMDLYFQSLQNIAESYGLDYTPERVPAISMAYLIFKLHLKFKLKVVILIDEYDSPYQTALLTLKDRTLAQEIINFLDSLFKAIKSKVEFLRLVLILGVSRLRLSTLQSGPNNYVDLTYNELFAGAFGFTSDEIEGFLPEITNRFNLSSKEDIDKFLHRLREEYDGYNYTFQYQNGKKQNVLNPVSTMKCLENKEFGCYWSETNNVNEIIRRIYFSKEPLKRFEHMKILREDIEQRRNPAIEAIPLEILMLVYGYLTIESYNAQKKEVILNFPNNEIKTALKENIAKYETSMDNYLSEEHGWLFELRWHMETGRLEGTMNTLKEMFDTSFSKTLQQGLNEFSNTARLVEKLRMAGIPCRDSVTFLKNENSTSEGGDVDVQTVRLKINFIMSIKFGYSSITAMKQFVHYLRKYRTTFLEAIDEPREAWLVGVNFDSRTGGLLHDWIGVLLKKDKLRFNQCKASMPKLCERLQKECEPTMDDTS